MVSAKRNYEFGNLVEVISLTSKRIRKSKNEREARIRMKA